MRALASCTVVHFACHGLSDWSDPGISRLLLHDHDTHPLTVRDLARSQPIDGSLAYLSACSTSDTSPRTVDEAVHLTAAFQLAGYRQIIGTLWPVNDSAATRVAVEIYHTLTDGGEHAPDSTHAVAALHGAVRRLRTDYPKLPSRWAGYIHAGDYVR